MTKVYPSIITPSGLYESIRERFSVDREYTLAALHHLLALTTTNEEDCLYVDSYSWPPESFALDSGSHQYTEHSDSVMSFTNMRHDHTRWVALTERVMAGFLSIQHALKQLIRYDKYNDGYLLLGNLKKCLAQNRIELTDSDFDIVFNDFLDEHTDGEVYFNYIAFFQSWKNRDSHSEESFLEYSSTAELTDGSFSLREYMDNELEQIVDGIRVHINSLFGRYRDIFVSLHAHNVLRLNDFVSYLNNHNIQCSLNQLLHIMNPFLHNSDCASWEEFEKFVRSIQRSDEAFIIPAFPSTFGVSTHINMCKHDDEDDFSQPSIRRHKTVSANLNRLPTFYSLISE